MVNSLERLTIQRAEQKADDQPTVNDDTQIVVSLKKLLSDDEVSSTNLPNNSINIPITSTESTPVAKVSDFFFVFTKEQLERIQKIRLCILPKNEHICVHIVISMVIQRINV